MILLSITGQDTLAAATRECCVRHFAVTTKPITGCDILWTAYDVPLSEDGVAHYDRVLQWIADDINELIAQGTENKPLVLISSQMPVGTIERFEKGFPGWDFAYSPENIRVATAVKDFENQTRVIVGVRDPKHHAILSELFAPFTKRVIFTDPETAEMTKHALNCFLGLNIAFANEVARLCVTHNANMDVITEALRSDFRVGAKAPLKAGGPFNSGHLERDIFVLNELAKKHGISVPIISHIMESNSGK